MKKTNTEKDKQNQQSTLMDSTQTEKDCARPKSKLKKTLGTVLKIIFILLIVLVIAAITISCLWIRKLNNPNTIQDKMSQEGTHEDYGDGFADEAVDGLPVVEGIKGNASSSISLLEQKIMNADQSIETFLLYGLDTRYSGTAGSRSDVIMIIVIDWDKGDIKLASIQRDILVEIPDRGLHKINAAYSLGGLELAEQTLEHNFGIKADHVAVINFKSIIELVDIIGGVEIEILESDFDRRTIESGIREPGLQTLSGEQVLAYVRNRYTGGAFARTERQRKVIQSIMEHKEQLTVGEIISALNVVSENMYIDMNSVEIIKATSNLLNMDIDSIQQFSAPIDDSYQFANYLGASVVDIDFSANIEGLADFLYGE